MYYVVHPDGSRYGPADLPTLQAWATEGRLIQTTTVIDAVTGQQIIAGRVSGLVWQSSQATVLPGQMSQTPYGGAAPGQLTQTPYGTTGYPHQVPPYGGYPSASRQTTLGTVAMICGISTILLLCLCGPLGIISGLAGIAVASSAKAKGDRNAGWWMALNVVGLLLNIAVLVVAFTLKPRMGGL